MAADPKTIRPRRSAAKAASPYSPVSPVSDSDLSYLISRLGSLAMLSEEDRADAAKALQELQQHRHAALAGKLGARVLAAIAFRDCEGLHRLGVTGSWCAGAFDGLITATGERFTWEVRP